MTHGTDRDTPTGGADRDSADAPGARVAGAPREGVPQPHDAPEATAPVADAADAPGTGTDTSPDDTAATGAAGHAASDAPGTDPRGAAAETPPTTGSQRPQGSTPPPSIPVTRPRPLAPPPSEPLTAWPSWDDVAVTAPPAEPTAPDAGGTEAFGDVSSAAGAPAAASASDEPVSDEPVPDEPSAAEPVSAEPVPDEPSAAESSSEPRAAATPDEPSASPTPDAPSAVPSGAPASAASSAPAPLPPLSMGGLSALAFTALNAASVGVPAHALPTSPLPQSGTAQPATTGDEPGAAEPSGAEATSEDAAGALTADEAGESSVADAAADAALSDAVDAADVDAPAHDAVATEPADDEAADARSADDRSADDQRADDEPADDAPADAAPAVAASTEDPATDPSAPPAVEAFLVPRGPRADETAVVPPAGAADETAVVPSPSAADETAVVPPAARADETTVVPPATRADETAVVPAPADGADVATRATPVAPVVPPRRTSARPAPPALEPEADESLIAVFEPEETTSRWPRALAITGGALALLAAVYVGSSYALADRVPRGATVAGVEIGGLSSADAEQRLGDELADRTTSPVAVVAQDVQAELDPTAAGLELDAAATVARLTGVDLAQPARVWRHVVGVGAQPPVTVVDESALDAALTQLAGSLVLAPVDGTVVFADGAAHATDAVDGWELDTEGAATVLEDGWLTATRPVELPTSVVPPAVTQEETDRALAELAQPLTAAPVTVQVADRQAVLDVATLTAHAAVVPVEGDLELQLDGEALTQSVLAQLPDLLTTAADARFEFQDGAPVIVPGTPGTTLDPATLAASVADAATAGEGRLAAVELVQSDPAETTAALEALGVKEVVSEFSTPLTSEPRRTSNIATGLRNITGTLVRPGEVFSLTEALGPIDAAHGFVQAGAIVNGEHTDAWGGGLSQVSTTTFNAAYFAGYEDVEHKPHSEWFQRYPEGREATIFTGVLDMRWRNNTPYGALVQGYVADGRAHVRIWSTKHFTVETEKSGRSNVVAPTTVYSQSRTCEPQSAGNPGFTVTNTRKVYLNGELVASEPYTWRYKPQNKVICGTPPAPGDPASPAP